MSPADPAEPRVDVAVAAKRLEVCLELCRCGHFDSCRSALKARTSEMASDQDRTRAYVDQMSELVSGLQASAGSTGAASPIAPAVTAVRSWASTIATYQAQAEASPAPTLEGKPPAASMPPQYDDISASLGAAGLSDDVAGDVALSLVSSVQLGATISAIDPTPGADGAQITAATSDVGAILDATMQQLPTALRAHVSTVQDDLLNNLHALYHAIQAEVGRSVAAAGTTALVHGRIEHEVAGITVAPRSPTDQTERDAQQRSLRATLERQVQSRRRRIRI